MNLMVFVNICIIVDIELILDDDGKILLSCKKIGNCLHKVGLAKIKNIDENNFNIVEGRWNVF